MIKRSFDLVASGIGLLVLSPLLIIIGIAMLLTEGRPIFFIQSRIGKNGHVFKMLKFRSMKLAEEGRAITVGEDSRITKIGKVLRKTKVDELPQLWNVLVGDMSLVGPRPEVERYVQLYSDEQREVLKLRPGITDPASFGFFDEAELLGRVADPEKFYIEKLMPEKIRLNLDYAKSANFWRDLVLIVATVLRPVGIHIDIFKFLNLRAPKVLC